MTLPTFKKMVSILLVTTAVCILPYFLHIYWEIEFSTIIFSTSLLTTLSANASFTDDNCDNVLDHMTVGHWKTRTLTKKENTDIIGFLTNAHTRYRLPPNYQRPDGLCGNVTHTGSGIANWFRALCDPKGSTPCCYHNTCVMKSVEDCVCEDCYDMRNMKHAEYSTWIPSHPGCPYKEHSPQEACDILNGSRIVFVGDSLVRHLYTAMLLIVTGNMNDGAIQQNADKKQKASCEDMYMFTEKLCRLLLNYELLACDGTARLKMLYYYSSSFGGQLRREVSQMAEKSMIITGIGIHNGFNDAVVKSHFLLPTLTYMKNESRTWPRLLWVGNHAPGILKSPVVLSQTYESVKSFNSEMEPFLNIWKVPIFDTFNLTDGMMSFDGEHYGIGINIVKANILLSYIEELRASQRW